MNGSEIVVSNQMGEIRALSKEISLSQLLPQSLKGKPADVLVILLTGKELGLEPTQALRGINVINGKASLSADLMGALVQRSSSCEYLRLVESSGTVATYETRRKGHPEPTRMSFTIQQAEAAGLTGNATYKKFPDAMLRARCLAAICRAVYPDLCLGLYDSDTGELTDGRIESSEPASTLKDQLRAQVAPKSDVVEGVVVSETPAVKPAPTAAPGTPGGPVLVVSKPSFQDRIRIAATLDELRTLFGEIKKLSPDAQEPLKAPFQAKRKALEAVAAGVSK